MSWTPESWRDRPRAQAVDYPDIQAVDSVVSEIRSLPPLVTSFEVERLKSELAEVCDGKRLVLQGGDCAETLADCRSDIISNKLKILLQMSLVLIHGAKRPVVRIGRIAGQYAKPRSKTTETRNGVTLPNYFGDLINSPEFTKEAREFNPRQMLEGFKHASLTLNFIRSLTKSGFADFHHPEYWDLSFFESAHLSTELRETYQRTSNEVAESFRFMQALGDINVDELSQVEFYTSHEGLNLYYESAQTRKVPRRQGHYCLSTHLPWIGERTRDLNGAHVEFFRGIQNPVGVKVSGKANADDVIRLIDILNPQNTKGKLVLITRIGATQVEDKLPALLQAVASANKNVVWLCDPMHGNTETTDNGFKTRDFENILAEIEATVTCHKKVGTYFGGMHIELTGEDVTECTGGAMHLTEEDLATNYATACDPRLNYAQALEMAFRVAALYDTRNER